MNVSVILIAYYGDDWLPACLDSLAEASAQPIHLVLVDNHGNERLDRLDLERFDCERLATERPLGFAEANNFALVNATRLEDIVLFLNQDTLGRPGWIDRCIACFEASPELGGLSPMIRTYDWEDWDTDFLSFVDRSGQRAELDVVADAPPWFEVEEAPAPALAVRTSILRAIGPFDPVYGSYYEDSDLCLRIRRAGFAIGFCRTTAIAHYNGSTTTDRTRALRRSRQITRNRVLYRLRASDAPRPRSAFQALVADMPRRMARGLLRRSPAHPFSATCRAYGDLLAMAGRLFSRSRDERMWRQYLERIGWPDRVPGLRPHRSAPSQAPTAP